jgi:hypothetical protein
LVTGMKDLAPPVPSACCRWRGGFGRHTVRPSGTKGRWE